MTQTSPACFRGSVGSAVVLLWVCAWSNSVVVAAPGSAEREAWEMLSEFRFADSLRMFEQMYAEKQGGDSRSVKTGYALNLLNRQPRTKANIRRAANLFEEIVSVNPDDDLGILAQYYLARIPQWHSTQPDVDEAARRYRELVERYPQHLVGQLAYLKLAFLRVYAFGPTLEEKRALMAELEESSSILTAPAVRRNFNRLMGYAYSRYWRDYESALPHYKEAISLNVHKWNTRARMYLRAGEISRRLGYNEDATRYFRMFLDEYPQDRRGYEIEQRLKEIESRK